MKIRKLHKDEKPPLDLLLLADPSIKIVKEYLERGECFVAEESAEFLGVYVLLPTRPETIELVNIAVDEEHQNKGIGKQLVMDAINRARSYGYKTITVGTGNSSIAQLAFYQKCGFRMVGVDVDFFVKNYTQIIVENGILCRDMVRFSQDL